MIHRRPRVAYGAVIPGDALTALGDDSLDIVGGIVRTERDTVVVAIERRQTFHHPGIILQVIRRDRPDSAPVFLRSERIALRSYELDGLAGLLRDAADALEGDEQ